MTFHIRRPDSEITCLEVFWDTLSSSKRLWLFGVAGVAFLAVGSALTMGVLSLVQAAAQHWPAPFAAIAPYSPWSFAAGTAWNCYRLRKGHGELPSLGPLLVMGASAMVMGIHYG